MEDENRERPEERTFFEQSQNPRTPSGGNRPALIALVLIVLLALGLGGWFILKGRGGASPTPAPTPQIEITTPSPTPGVDRSQIKIEILNGTGTPGDAAFLKDRLSPLGYSDFVLGNASSEDNKSAKVSFTSGVAEELRQEIEDKLREVYETVETGGGVAGEVDVRVVTGLRRGRTPKPTATATPTATPKPTATGTPSPSPSPTPTKSPSPTPTASP